MISLCSSKATSLTPVHDGTQLVHNFKVVDLIVQEAKV